MTTEQLEAPTKPDTEASEINHYACVEKDERAVTLCGIEYPMSECNEFCQVDCVVCLDLRKIRSFCPKNGTCCCLR
jgi:hypothetical protein